MAVIHSVGCITSKGRYTRGCIMEVAVLHSRGGGGGGGEGRRGGEELQSQFLQSDSQKLSAYWDYSVVAMGVPPCELLEPLMDDGRSLEKLLSRSDIGTEVG